MLWTEVLLNPLRSCQCSWFEMVLMIFENHYHEWAFSFHFSSYYLYNWRSLKYPLWHPVYVANGLTYHWLKLDKWPLGLKLDVSWSFRATVSYDWPLLCWQEINLKCGVWQCFFKAVTEIRDITLYAIWQKITMLYKLSGKTKFSVASCNFYKLL